VSREEVDPAGALHPVRDGVQVRARARDQAVEASLALGPTEPVEGILDAEHGRCVDRRPLEDVLGEPPALGETEDLRERPGGGVLLEPLHGARREREHAVAGLAAEDLLPRPGRHVELGPRDLGGEDR
jgi:hypothetical protein